MAPPAGAALAGDVAPRPAAGVVAPGTVPEAGAAGEVCAAGRDGTGPGACPVEAMSPNTAAAVAAASPPATDPSTSVRAQWRRDGGPVAIAGGGPPAKPPACPFACPFGCPSACPVVRIGGVKTTPSAAARAASGRGAGTRPKAGTAAGARSAAGA